MFLLSEGWRSPHQMPPGERRTFWLGCGCGLLLAVPALGLLLAAALGLLQLLQ